MATTMEPISPELALVDPELARAHLAWLESGAGHAAPGRAGHESGPAPGSTEERARHRFWTAAKIAAAVSLAANGFLVAFVVARDRPATAIPPVAAPPSVSAPVGRNTKVERRVLSLVAVSESRRLPSTLIDPSTGLPKNNLQAVCRDSRSGSQLCVVRPAQHHPGEGLYVRYTPSADGAGHFTWYSYRTG
jgi:hypothetical protein